MDLLEKIGTEIIATVVVGVLGPPLVAVILSLSSRPRELLRKPWVVSGLTTISIATIVSVVFWTLVGGVAFSDVNFIDAAGSYNSGDLKENDWKTIPQTRDEVNVKYTCFLTRISLTSGGTCALRKNVSGWQIATNPDLSQQRCIVSCLKIDRWVSPFDFRIAVIPKGGG